jgi:hypothetical protein
MIDDGNKVFFEIYPIRQEISFLRKNYFVYPSVGDHPIRLEVVDKTDNLDFAQDFILSVKPSRLSMVDSRVITYEPGEKNILKLRIKNWLPINTISKGRYLLSFIIKGKTIFLQYFSKKFNFTKKIFYKKNPKKLISRPKLKHFLYPRLIYFGFFPQ